MRAAPVQACQPSRHARRIQRAGNQVVHHCLGQAIVHRAVQLISAQPNGVKIQAIYLQRLQIRQMVFNTLQIAAIVGIGLRLRLPVRVDIRLIRKPLAKRSKKI